MKVLSLSASLGFLGSLFLVACSLTDSTATTEPGPLWGVQSVYGPLCVLGDRQSCAPLCRGYRTCRLISSDTNGDNAASTVVATAWGRCFSDGAGGNNGGLVDCGDPWIDTGAGRSGAGGAAAGGAASGGAAAGGAASGGSNSGGSSGDVGVSGSGGAAPSGLGGESSSSN